MRPEYVGAVLAGVAVAVAVAIMRMFVPSSLDPVAAGLIAATGYVLAVIWIDP